MAKFYTGLRDVQLDAPVTYCPRCGGEVYQYTEVAALDGGLVHMDCMTPEEWEEFPTYPAASFFEEAC